MRNYAALVEEDSLRSYFLDRFLHERDLTLHGLEQLCENSEYERAVGPSDKIQAKLLEPLHYKQISLLKEWRTLKQSQPNSEHQEILQSLLLTVNAIAGAMGYTG
jgi:phosphoenolpyruvate carboxylase